MVIHTQAANTVETKHSGGQNGGDPALAYATVQWVDAMRRAGVNERTISAVLTEHDSPPIPNDLVTAKEAGARFGIPVGTVHTWKRAGHLKEWDRRKGAARGGGFPLFDAVQIQALIDNPPKMGRPRTRPNNK